MSVSLGASKSKFSAAVDKTGRIYVEGTVRAGRPYLTKIGELAAWLVGWLVGCGLMGWGAWGLLAYGRGPGSARLFGDSRVT
jgi:hypothetical protein